MAKAKRARKAETPKQPSPCLRLRAPYLYPDQKLPSADAAIRRDYEGMASKDHLRENQERERVTLGKYPEYWQ
jgi:hypothetical protein